MLEDAPVGCYVADIEFPGTWIEPSDIGDSQQRWEVQNTLRQLANLLGQAALALRFFEIARSENRSRYEAARNSHDAVRKGALVPQMLGDGEAGHRALVEAAHAAWKAGTEPMEYVHQMPIMFARSFVLALDRYAKALAAFSADIQREEVSTAKDFFEKSIPDLRHVRNNIAHVEDRARGLRQGGKEIDAKPVSTPLVQAPEGGVLVVESLTDDLFGGTGATGEVVEVRVNRDSLRVARDSLQDVVNAFSWRGPRDLYPR